MFSSVSKQAFGIAALAVVLAVVAGLGSGDRIGVVLLLASGVAASLLGLASSRTGVRDPIPPPEPAPTRVDPAAAGSPSGWPIFGALVAGALAVGASVGASVVIPALIALAVAVAGWFGQTWREHPSWTPAIRERVTSRGLRPLGLPVATLVLLLIVAVSLSRVLLAVDKNAASLIALVVAVIVLGAFFYLANNSVGPSAVIALGAVALLLTVAAGATGAAKGERHFEVHHADSETIEVVADAIAFDKDEFDLTAGEETSIVFRNAENVFHNVAIYDGAENGVGGRALFNGAVFSGPETKTYKVTLEQAGTYEFRCDIHPTAMVGKVVVK